MISPGARDDAGTRENVKSPAALLRLHPSVWRAIAQYLSHIPLPGARGIKPDSRRTQAICPTGVITILHYTGDVSALPATGTVLRVADIQPRTASATTSCIAPATQTPAHPRFDQPYAPRAEPTAPPRK